MNIDIRVVDTSNQLFIHGMYTWNDVFSIMVLSTKKNVLQFFGKGFHFPENLFQS